MNTATFPAHARSFIHHVIAGEWDEARATLRRHPELIQNRNSVKETPLHWLAIENEIEGVRMLIDAGAAVNCVYHDGSTVLADCAGLGLFDVCQLLLDHGADPNQRSTFMQESALHAAARYSQEARVIDLLIDRGACPNDRDKNQSTPLHVAAFMNNLIAAERLVARGASTSEKDSGDSSPLDDANSPEMIQLLKAAATRGH